MKNILATIGVTLALLTTCLYAETGLNVVTTLPDYAFFAKEIGGERVSVKAIVRGDQDAHFIRPKPSFATALRQADVFVATGLDLELWAQTVIDNSGNGKIRSGQAGYVSAATGMNLLEKPKTISRIPFCKPTSVHAENLRKHKAVSLLLYCTKYFGHLT